MSGHGSFARAAHAIRIGAAALLVAAFGGAFGADAPPAAPPLVEKVEVARLLIDVAALDRDGKPLLGLGPADFVVKIDGDQREVLSVDAPLIAAPSAPSQKPVEAPGAPPPSAAAPAAPAPPRFIAIVFHADGISPLYRSRAVEAARKIMSTAIEPGDRLAIAMLTSNGLDFVLPFTRAGEVTPAALPSPDSLVGSTAPLASRARELSDNLARCRQSAKSMGSCFENVSSEFVQTSRVESRAAMHNLTGLVSAMSPLPGRKAIVLLSDGLVLTPGQAVIDAFGRNDTALAGYYMRLVDPPNWDFFDLVSRASRQRISFYCWRTGQGLDIDERDASHQISGDELEKMQASAYGSLERMTADTLRDLSNSTGGRVLLGASASDVGPGFFDRMKAVYTLAIAAVDGDSIRSKVKVKLAKAKGTVVAPDHLTRPVVAKDRLAARLQLDAVRGDGVTATLMVDLSTVAVERGERPADSVSRLAFYHVVYDATGRVVNDDYALIGIPRAAPASGPYAYPLDLRLGPGTYVVKIQVADVGTGALFSTSESFTVPADPR